MCENKHFLTKHALALACINYLFIKSLSFLEKREDIYDRPLVSVPHILSTCAVTPAAWSPIAMYSWRMKPSRPLPIRRQFIAKCQDDSMTKEVMPACSRSMSIGKLFILPFQNVTSANSGEPLPPPFRDQDTMRFNYEQKNLNCLSLFAIGKKIIYDSTRLADHNSGTFFSKTKIFKKTPLHSVIS